MFAPTAFPTPIMDILKPFVLTAVALAAAWGSASAQVPDTSFYVANGDVFAITSDSDNLYIGGDFTQVGPPTGSGVPIDLSTGSVTLKPLINGSVLAVVADGSGGWFVGGSFTHVGGTPRQNLAHIQADGSLSSWNPNPNGTVDALVLHGGLVYVGGSFSTVGGLLRSSIAAVNATTGVPTAWAPLSDGSVFDIEIDGSTLYACGSFTFIGGQSRNYIAGLDISTGAATAWTPTAIDNWIFDMDVDGTQIYIGGLFTMVGGASARLAALDRTTGDKTSWSPDVLGTQIFSVVRSGPNVYIGGTFGMVDDGVRTNLASIDTTTGIGTSWAPNPNGRVRDLLINGPLVYVGGDFSTIGGQTRNGVAALHATTGVVSSWDPNLNDGARALALDSPRMFVGGIFSSVGGTTRNRIAAIDLTTGSVTGWDPNADGTVRALHVVGEGVIAGGDFTNIGGVFRNRIAMLEASSGFATAWDPDANGTVRTLELGTTTVYAGGDFTDIGDNPRDRIAELELATGDATLWDPNSNDAVYDLEVSGDVVYAGGDFSNIGGSGLDHIAAISRATGLATVWDAQSNGRVRSIVADMNTIYVGGEFDDIGGALRVYIAALDATTALATPWDPVADDNVYAISKQGNVIYAGGQFDNIGSDVRSHLAALDAVSGLALDWNPIAENWIWSLHTVGPRIYIGGEHKSLGGWPNSHVSSVPQIPTLTAILPSSAGNGGQVSTVLTGHGFQPGATVELDPLGIGTTINGSHIEVDADGTVMRARFDLAGQFPGFFDVTVVNPDLQSATLAGGFEITEALPHRLRVDVIGPSAIRANRATAFDFVVRNDSNNDAPFVPLWITGIPAGTSVDTKLNLVSAPTQGLGEPDWSLSPLTFDGSNGQYLALVLPRIPADGSQHLRLLLTVPPEVTSFSLNAAVTPPWIDSNELRACMVDNGVVSNPDCMGTQLGFANSYLSSQPSSVDALNGISLWAKIAYNCEGTGDLNSSLAASELMLGVMLQLIEQSGNPPSCLEAALPEWQDPLDVQVVMSIDPNDKLGIQGYGPDGLVGSDQLLSYSIRFENLESATAPAQDVVVFDFLDGVTLDFSTLSLGLITFGEHTIEPPPGVTQFTTDVDLRPANDLIVRVAVNFDQATGLLIWNFNSLVPESGLPPQDPLAGFLPPNVNPPEGDGSVFFSIMPKPGLAGGTEITNSATITFDDSDPILTNQWLNTIDDGLPASNVLPLPNGQSTDSLTFSVQWQSDGPPPDLRDVSVYVSIDGQDFVPWRLHATVTADTFASEPGHTYGFYSLARDSSGNLEPPPMVPDAETATIVSVGGARVLSLQLEGAAPNPAKGDVNVWFTLPRQGRATLDVIDVSGRRVLRREVGQFGPGRHVIDIAREVRLAPGMYFLRLSQDKRASSARVVVIQ